MLYDYKSKKIVAVLSEDLLPGVALNVVGHMAISVGAYGSELMGRPTLFDSDGTAHTGIAKYPLIITKASPIKILELIRAAREHQGLLLIEYPEQMLHTGHDDELAEALSIAKTQDLKFLGAILYGDFNTVSSLTKRFSLWR
jgi:hypothetical protein